MTQSAAPLPPLRPILTRAQRIKYLSLIAIWVLLSAVFWLWWLKPSHIISGWSFGLVSAAIFWIFFLQVYFLALFLRAARPAMALSQIDALRGARIAMVVTKAPSEPFEVVQKTLRAMLANDVPHDTWLADEDPSPETIAWCAQYGVQISTRKGRDDYHRATWPRRTRCKEGNLAFFYDHYGYDRYDFVAQFDADHVPEPDYLRQVLPCFADPHVGYASAPSICDSNAGESWAARTRLYAEAAFHGSLQSGYSSGLAPMCIGSHYTVRTAALRDVGGLGPELAEDHSTSMLLNAGGWRGVHAIDAIAHGDGPASFADMITQEFQWSRSLTTLLLQYTPDYLGQMPWRLRLQFVFCQVWYPLFALFMAIMYLMPVTALLFDMRFADVTYPAFLMHAVPPMVVLIVLAYQLKRDGLFRPRTAKVLSWERMLFPLAQWIWVLWGCSVAVWDRVTGRFVDFRITPKGDQQRSSLPARVYLPYFCLALIAIIVPLSATGVTQAKGFYLLCLANGIVYAALLAVIVGRHLIENEIPLPKMGSGELTQMAGVLCLMIAMISAMYFRGVESLAALSLGLEPIISAHPEAVVSGAGSGPPGTIRYVFELYRR
ncbi:MAG: N-acetylglucosaminyltransferase [Rhodobacterales bacterium]|nr:MAG: N-acetylglucosaminyltransferase [Rhodobacterales bacterium]